MEPLPADVNDTFTVHGQTPLQGGRGVSLDIEASPVFPGTFSAFINCKRGKSGIHVVPGRPEPTSQPTPFVYSGASSETTLAALADATIDAICRRGGVATGGTSHPTATPTSSTPPSFINFGGSFVMNGRGWQTLLKSMTNASLRVGTKAFCLSGSKLKVKSS